MAASSPARKNSLVVFLAIGLGMAALLFGLAGTLAWWQGWAFILVNIGLSVLLSQMVFKKDPALVEERAKASLLAPRWDRVLVKLINLALPLMLLVAALDKRFAWSPTTGNPVSMLALLVVVMGVVLTFQAMRSNPFFSSHVRIQEDRGHQVVSHGPYRVVRHPGYTGALLYNLALPVLLGSRWAVVVGLLFLILTLVRTALEDRMLCQQLQGYREYAEQVRYRLVPFLW